MRVGLRAQINHGGFLAGCELIAEKYHSPFQRSPYLCFCLLFLTQTFREFYAEDAEEIDLSGLQAAAQKLADDLMKLEMAVAEHAEV